MKEKKTDSQDFFREIQIEFLIHELKDPLSVIETGMRVLLEKKEKFGALSSRQEKTLRRSLRNTRKARQMLYDMLEVGRSQAGCIHCQAFDPANTAYEVLKDTLEFMSEKISEQCNECGKEESIRILSDHGVFFDISPQLVHAKMIQDEIKFRMILGNLIKNALHYRKSRLEISMRAADDFLLTEVADDGPGIAPAYHQAVFQRYAQVKNSESAEWHRKGHGLGLACALILTRSLGGDIELESGKGNGATFRLILPMTLKNGE